MMGDNEVDIDGDGEIDRFFKGAMNLSASLDVIKERFPSPDKIVLAGNSAGGFAVNTALPLVRKLYPDVQIDLINDSGLGILNPNRMTEFISYWGAESFFPNSCSSCIGDDGNLTDYHKYLLNQDINARMAYISSKQDATFATGIIGGGTAFESQILEAANELKADFPDRFNSIITNGDTHTFLIRSFNYSVNNTTISNWLTSMIENDENWESEIE
jgi:hypothetical protein